MFDFEKLAVYQKDKSFYSDIRKFIKSTTSAKSFSKSKLDISAVPDTKESPEHKVLRVFYFRSVKNLFL
jgi:hypothetical protein